MKWTEYTVNPIPENQTHKSAKTSGCHYVAGVPIRRQGVQCRLRSAVCAVGKQTQNCNCHFASYHILISLSSSIFNYFRGWL